MKKTTFLSLFSLALTGMFFLQSCSNDDDGDDGDAVEFIADDNTFAGFTDWTLAATFSGVDAAMLGMAHAGDNTESERTVYIKDNQAPINGVYPIGTLIVKDTKVAGETVVLTAMAKRGFGFNPNNNDWEWFIINADGTIATDGDVVKRGADLNNNGCGNCHSSSNAVDYVFTN